MLPIEQFVVVDLETTGLNDRRHPVVEVAVARVDVPSGEIALVLDHVVFDDDPSVFMVHPGAFIFQHSTLKYEEVLRAPALSTVIPQIQALVDEYPVTAFQKTFDLGYLEARGVTIPRELPCLMHEMAGVCKIPWWNYEYDCQEYKWPNFGEAWHQFFPAVPRADVHRAGQDARDEAKIALELVRRGIWDLDELCAQEA